MNIKLKGKIICGYQGIGKTFITRLFPEQFIDLDSSLFFVDNKRDDNWYKVYSNIAVNLAENGFTVFLSSHKILREWLDLNDIPFLVIVPSIEIKDEWIKRLSYRYTVDPSIKNFKALTNAKEGTNYEETITELMYNHKCIILDSLKYNLVDVLKNYEKNEIEYSDVYGQRTIFNY